MFACIAASLPRRWCTSVKPIKYIMTMTMDAGIRTNALPADTILSADRLRSYFHVAALRQQKTLPKG